MQGVSGLGSYDMLCVIVSFHYLVPMCGKCKAANERLCTLVVVACSMILEVRLKGLIHVQRSTNGKQCSSNGPYLWRLKALSIVAVGCHLSKV